MMRTMAVATRSLIDYRAVGDAVLERKAARGVTLKQIAAEAGVDPSKLTTLTKQAAQLSTDNLLRICDWLEQPIEYFRFGDAPAWLEKRLAAGHGIEPGLAARLSKERDDAIARQHARFGWAPDRPIEAEAAEAV